MDAVMIDGNSREIIHGGGASSSADKKSVPLPARRSRKKAIEAAAAAAAASNAANACCGNPACRAVLQGQYGFCRRCSCCICGKYDENKDPSLWLVCGDVDDHAQQDSASVASVACGLSCHLRCALEDKLLLDARFHCSSCGTITCMLGSARKQLLQAKAARRVDALHHRIDLASKLLNGTQKLPDCVAFVEEALQKLKEEIGPNTALSARGHVNRLSSSVAVLELISKALQCFERSKTEDHRQILFSVRPVFQIQINHITANSVQLEVIEKVPAKNKILGYQIWHRKMRYGYRRLPTISMLGSEKAVVTNLSPSTPYMFKAVAQSTIGDEGSCELRCCTEQQQEEVHLKPEESLTTSSHCCQDLVVDDQAKEGDNKAQQASVKNEARSTEELEATIGMETGGAAAAGCSSKSSNSKENQAPQCCTAMKMDVVLPACQCEVNEDSTSFFVEGQRNDLPQKAAERSFQEVTGANNDLRLQEKEEDISSGNAQGNSSEESRTDVQEARVLVILDEETDDNNDNNNNNNNNNSSNNNKLDENFEQISSPKDKDSIKSVAKESSSIPKPGLVLDLHVDLQQARHTDATIKTPTLLRPNSTKQAVGIKSRASTTPASTASLSAVNKDLEAMNNNLNFILPRPRLPDFKRAAAAAAAAAQSSSELKRTAAAAVAAVAQNNNVVSTPPWLTAAAASTMPHVISTLTTSSSKKELEGKLRKRSAEEAFDQGKKRMDKILEYCMRMIRWLECQGHLQPDFRMRFFTWLVLNASDQQRRAVNVYVQTMIGDPAALAAQLVDLFDEVIQASRHHMEFDWR